MHYSMFGYVTITCDYHLPSTMPPSSPARNSEKAYTFTVSLTVYSLRKKKASTKGKASTSKEKKSVKVKKLHFSTNDNNYLNFLQSILTSTDRSNTRYQRKGVSIQVCATKGEKVAVYCFVTIGC